MEDRPGEGVNQRRRPARFGATKFAPPAATAAQVPRPMLLLRLDEAGPDSLRLVVGSPGSGKSSLLAEWVGALPAGSVAWLNADAADRDPVRFWQGLITALQRCAPGFGVEAFDLLTLDAYASMSVQYSRGCPFRCEFCDVIEIFGRVPRVKTPPQVIAELDALYRLGWRGTVFLVDDNFIGNRREVALLLPALAAWQAAHDRPMALYTEASVDLAGERSDLRVGELADDGTELALLVGERHRLRHVAIVP